MAESCKEASFLSGGSTISFCFVRPIVFAPLTKPERCWVGGAGGILHFSWLCFTSLRPQKRRNEHRLLSLAPEAWKLIYQSMPLHQSLSAASSSAPRRGHRQGRNSSAPSYMCLSEGCSF